MSLDFDDNKHSRKEIVMYILFGIVLGVGAGSLLEKSTWKEGALAVATGKAVCAQVGKVWHCEEK